MLIKVQEAKLKSSATYMLMKAKWPWLQPVEQRKTIFTITDHKDSCGSKTIISFKVLNLIVYKCDFESLNLKKKPFYYQNSVFEDIFPLMV